MKKLYKKNFRGSYTVEAAFILPVVFTIIILIIYLTMYFHDKSILFCAASQSVLRGSQMINGGNTYAVVERCSNELIGNRLLATKYLETEITASGDDFRVEYAGVVPLPLGALLCRYLFGNSTGINIKASAAAKCDDAVKFIRRCRMIERNI